MYPSFDKNTGEICLTPELRIRRGMSRKDILAMAVNWEDWILIDGIPSAYRTIFNLPNRHMSPKTILIVHVGTLDVPLAFWSIVPWDLVDGAQKRREGKNTKISRKWFLEMFNSTLPTGGDWGDIDASYDHWNQTVKVVCNYRERFKTDKEWKEYRRENKF